MRIVVLITFISLCSSGFCKNKKISPLNHCDCGIVPDQLINNYHRIVGGTEAEINEFPWTVGLYTHYRCKGLPVCGGSLISTQHVLTAAHCIQRNIFSYLHSSSYVLLRGQSLTILTRFLPFLTTFYLGLTFLKEFLFSYRWHFHQSSTTYRPTNTSSCQRSLWMLPYYFIVYLGSQIDQWEVRAKRLKRPKKYPKC